MQALESLRRSDVREEIRRPGKARLDLNELMPARSYHVRLEATMDDLSCHCCKHPLFARYWRELTWSFHQSNEVVR